ncbi:MAG: PDZ domain-containing protein [Bacteroidota bacterium]
MVVFLLYHFSLQAQYNYFDLPYGKNKSVLPFENFDNIVIIETTINDSVPLRLILDSGVEGIIITDMDVVSKFADRCVRSFRITAPGTIEVLEACITSPVLVKVKGLVPAITNIIMLNEDYFSLESYIGTSVHGLIGLDKFRNMVVTTNYDRNMIRFTRPSRYKLPDHAEIIPISIDRGKPHMNSRVEFDNGTIMDLWLLIDSGANHPLLLENDSLEGYKPQKSIKATIGKGLAGNMKGEFARVGWLMLGNYRLDNIIASFTDSYLPISTSTRPGRHGTLGSGALSRFRVTFDYSRERMILQKGAKFRKPFEYNMSGITFRSMGSQFNLFEVSDIIPGSPADIAGIREGDILLAIDNAFTLTMTLGDVNRKLSSGEGVKVNLIMSREGKQLDVMIRLRKLI